MCRQRKTPNLYYIRGVESWFWFGLGRLVGVTPWRPVVYTRPASITEATRPASHPGSPSHCRSAAYSRQASPWISASGAPAAPGVRALGHLLNGWVAAHPPDRSGQGAGGFEAGPVRVRPNLDGTKASQAASAWLR